MSKPTRIGFIHPDLGIGGAERLVVDAALGLQKRNYEVEIFTSHHNPSHCFEETRDGALNVTHVRSPFFLPRSLFGRFHILFAHFRQLYLMLHLLFVAKRCDVYIVDQLSTCIPFIRVFLYRRVVFYCHFPDKLLADGEYLDNDGRQELGFTRPRGILKRIYRSPMDYWEELTTSQADLLLANSEFTARVFLLHFPSIERKPRVVYPGINVEKYKAQDTDADVADVVSNRPTFLSLNRFENKKNIGLAISAFAQFRQGLTAADKNTRKLDTARIVIGGGYDPRVKDNIDTLDELVSLTELLSLSYSLITSLKSPRLEAIKSNSKSPSQADILFLPNFTTAQRTVLLQSPHSIALLYTPNNEHFGIGPVEGMVCGLPVIACSSGGPKETIIDKPASHWTGWLRSPQVSLWCDAMKEAARLTLTERIALANRAKRRVDENFTLEKMTDGLEVGIKQVLELPGLSFWSFVQVDWIFMGISILLLTYTVYAKILEPLSAGMMFFTFLARRYFGPSRTDHLPPAPPPEFLEERVTRRIG